MMQVTVQLQLRLVHRHQGPKKYIHAQKYIVYIFPWPETIYMVHRRTVYIFPGLEKYTWWGGEEGVGRVWGCFWGDGVGRGWESLGGGGMERGLLNINDFFVLLWLAIIASCLNGSLTQVASKSVPGLQLSQSTRQQVHRPGTFQACYQIASNC